MPRPPRFPAAQAIIRDGLARRAFPAATIEVGTRDRPLWREAFGRLTYDDDAPWTTLDTIFDLASLTKVIATTSIAMRLTAARRITVGDPVTRWLPSFRGGDRQSITLEQLLDHSSGLPAHARLWEHVAGREAYLAAIAALPLERRPGDQAVYSDPGFIALGFALEAAGDAPLDAQFAEFAEDLREPIGYQPPAQETANIAPTEIDPWRGRLLRGEVHDENAAAIGGVAAHAGLFGTVGAVGAFARLVLSTFSTRTPLGTTATMRTFSTRSRVPGSSRALGWDTMLPTSSCGTRMSAHAVGHTGFTGTSLWIDPDRDVYVALLTNRVHPTRDNTALRALRPILHDAVMSEL